MKVARKVVCLSVAVFVAACVVDAALDSIFFRPGSFWDSLLLDVPAHSIYTRLLVTAFFLVFIVIAAKALSKKSLAEQALKRSEDKYRRIFEHSPIGIWHFDANGVITDCNGSFIELMGSTREKLLGFNMPKRLKNEAVRSALQSALSGHLGHFEGEYVSVTGGKATYSKTDFAPLFAEDGTVSGGIGIIEDITDRKKAEDTLRKSEERYRTLYEESVRAQEIYRSLIDSCPDAIVIYDTEGRVKHVSDSFVRTFGWTLDEVKGKILDYVPEEEKEITAARVRGVVHEGGVHGNFETKRLTKDGTVLDVRIAASRFHDHEGKSAGMLVILSDISERKRAEKALLESEERYRKLVENVDIGVTLVDSQFNVIMTNPAQVRMFGKTASDVIGQKCYKAFKDRDTVCPHCPGQRAMSSRQPAEIDVQRVNHKGDSVNLRLRAFPTFSPDGAVMGFIEVVDDITVRKRLEEQLRQAGQLEAIGRLAGGVAHDFNNLLTAIIGYAHVVLQRVPESDPNREKVRQISRAAERAAELTRKLLAFSRKQVLDVKVLDLNPVIADFEKIMRRLVGEDIELVTSLAPFPGRVKADRSQIEQILMNFAVNSRDAMPLGGKLMIETAAVELDADYALTRPDVQPGPHVMIAVSDDGVGMTSETRSRIFDPFFTTKEKGKGTGLGLSTVYGIVKQHHGHISVYSEPGRGTTFKVYLPAVDEPVEESVVPAAPQPQPYGTETILVVEDEEIVLRLACEALEALGYSVLCASTPDEALKLVQEHKDTIDLLLSDVVLPQMDGPSLFKQLVLLRPALKVLYVSGYTGNSIVRHGVLEPGVQFLPKPFTLEDLAAKVREALDDEA